MDTISKKIVKYQEESKQYTKNIYLKQKKAVKKEQRSKKNRYIENQEQNSKCESNH